MAILRKRNATVSLLTFCMASVIVFMSSCSDDDNNVIYRSAKCASLGLVDNSGNIQTDMGNTLILDERSSKYEFNEGERIFLNGHILEKKDENTFRIHIIQYKQLLTKDFIHSSDISEESLGNDPVNVEKAWFGGGYLNMRIALQHNPTSISLTQSILCMTRSKVPKIQLVLS